MAIGKRHIHAPVGRTEDVASDGCDNPRNPSFGSHRQPARSVLAPGTCTPSPRRSSGSTDRTQEMFCLSGSLAIYSTLLATCQ